MNRRQAGIDMRKLMKQHGLTQAGWKFDWDNARRRHGQTRFGDKTITLSREYTRVNPVEVVRNTMLHEIAHAVLPAGHGHDRVWRAKHIELGGTGERCTTPAKAVKGRWVGICPSGQHKTYRHRKIKSTYSCTPCHPGGFSWQHVLTWSEASK